MENLKIINDLKAIKELKRIGGEIYLVGGCVRDHYLGKDSKDIDIVVALLEEDVIIDTVSKYGRVDKVGESFGVIKFIPTDWKGEPIDIAMPRIDVLENKDKGHHGIKAQFSPYIPISEELNRRDFRLNSIAVALDGTIIDPFNGLEDIKNGIIRATSKKAFSEDPLRMLRAIQFASRFDFNIEPETWDLIVENSYMIKTISSERIVEELNKIFYKGKINLGIDLFEDCGLYGQIFETKLRHDLYRIDTIEDFYYSICGSSETYKNVLKGENKIFDGIQAIETILDNYDFTDFNKRKVVYGAYQISKAILDSGFAKRFGYADTIADFNEGKYPKKITEVSLNGNDLIEMGFKGKEIGDILKEVLFLILEDKLENEKESLINFCLLKKNV